MKYNKLLPILTSILVFIFLEIYIIWPFLIYFCFVAANFMIIYTAWCFCRKTEIKENFFDYFIIPSLLTSSIIAYSVFVKEGFFLHLLFVVHFFLIYIYFKIIYNYLLKKSSYIESSLSNFFLYGNFLVIFFIGSSAFAFQSFIDISAWVIMIIIIFIIAIILFEILKINNIDKEKIFFYVAIGSLIIAEIYWALSYMPFNYNILGFLLAVCYYVLSDLTRITLKNNISKIVVRRYVIFSLISIIIILLTATWV